MQKAIDVSKHQNTFTPAAAQAGGVSTVILRAACNSMKKHKKGSVIL